MTSAFVFQKRKSQVKITNEQIKQIIKEELDKVLQENNPLGGDSKTRIPNNPLGGDSKTRIPNNPLGGDSKTRTGPAPKENNPLSGPTRVGPQKKNPLGGDGETRTPDNPQGVPLQKRIAKIEQVLKQLIAKIK